MAAVLHVAFASVSWSLHFKRPLPVWLQIMTGLQAATGIVASYPAFVPLVTLGNMVAEQERAPSAGKVLPSGGSVVLPSGGTP